MRQFLLAAAALAGAATPRARAQRGRGMRDEAAAPTITGTITWVDSMPSPRIHGGGLHVRLNVGDATFDVHLGPVAWLAGKSLALATGDTVQVTGSIVTDAGGQGLIATTITKGDVTVPMRASTGMPLWPRTRFGSTP